MGSSSSETTRITHKQGFNCLGFIMPGERVTHVNSFSFILYQESSPCQAEKNFFATEINLTLFCKKLKVACIMQESLQARSAGVAECWSMQ
jgi:hypothetical protein